VASKVFVGQRGTVQLDRDQNLYVFRMVVKNGFEQDPQNLVGFPDIPMELSREVFSGAPVDVYLCDDMVKTVRIFTGNRR
jgi:hypothetical protein